MQRSNSIIFIQVYVILTALCHCRHVAQHADLAQHSTVPASVDMYRILHASRTHNLQLNQMKLCRRQILVILLLVILFYYKIWSWCEGSIVKYCHRY